MFVRERLFFLHSQSFRAPEEVRVLRVRSRRTSHSGGPASHHLRPLLNREILNVGQATPAVFAQSVATKSGAKLNANSAKLFLTEP